MTTGSLVNHIYNNTRSPEPVVGMGATITHYTDRSAGTVVEVLKNGTLIAVQGDTATRTDKNGMSETQNYDYAPNPNGGISWFRKDKHGRWAAVRKNEDTGRWVKSSQGLILGRRDKYHDFSF